MGEIVRRIIQRLAEEGALFGRRVPASLKSKNSLSTPQMSKIDHDTSTDLLRTADILQEACGLAVDQITLQSTQVVRGTVLLNAKHVVTECQASFVRMQYNIEQTMTIPETPISFSNITCMPDDKANTANAERRCFCCVSVLSDIRSLLHCLLNLVNVMICFNFHAHTRTNMHTYVMLARWLTHPPNHLWQVQEICHLVGWRAGRLKAAAIAAVMRQLEREDGTRTVVGVDGGVFEHYGYYRDAIMAGLTDIMGKKAADAVEFKHVNDGSSLGAAYLAAAMVRAKSLQDGSKLEPENDFEKENRGLQEGPTTPKKSGGKSKNGRHDNVK